MNETSAEERLQLALAASDIGIWEWVRGADGIVLDARCRYLCFLESTEPPMVTLECLRARVHPDDLAGVRAIWEQPAGSLSRNEVQGVCRVVSVGGTRRWLLVRGRRHVDATGRLVRALGTILDVTDREQLREEAQWDARRATVLARTASRLVRTRSVEENFRVVCDETVTALRIETASVYVFDGEGDLALPAYVHGAPPGLSPRLASRKAFEALHAAHGGVAHVPDISMAVELPNREFLLKAGLRCHASAALVFGGKVIGALNVGSFVAPRRFDAGEIALLAGMADLTAGVLANVQLAAQKARVEADLRASEQLYRGIVEQMREGVMLADPMGRVVFLNPSFARMFGYSREEIMGHSLGEVLFDEDRAERIEAWNRHVGTGITRPYSAMQRYRARDGHEVWASIAVVPMVEDGLLTGVLGVFNDVTAARKLELQLQHAQKLESLGVLAGGIAHDFNNLLVGVLGHAALALDDLPPESLARPSVEQIQLAAVRASELTRQMLAYAGKGRFTLAKIDVGRLVEEMAHLLSASIAKGVVINYRLAAGLPPVEGDPTQLRQVVMNLITNASDAIGDKSGVVTIATSIVQADRVYLSETYTDDSLGPGCYVALEVSDTGAGMTPEVRARIFDPFFTTKFTGRGLGLAAVIGIVRAHSGAMHVESEPGRGSTFKLLLPTVRGHADEAAPPAPTSSRCDGDGLVLVVDDDEAVRNVMKRTLERGGFHVLVAIDGVDGLEVFRAHRDTIRAVVLDVTMPRMGGEEMFRELRLLDANVRVVLSSGYSEQEATGRFAGKGLAGFLEKPFRPRDLIERVRAVMEAPAAKTS